jgi:hypothetical protein
MAGWAMRELARWHAAPTDAQRADDRFVRLNAEDREIFLYRFESGAVDMAEKPATLDINPVTLGRARNYLRFFRDVARLLPAGFCTTIAMGMGDKVEFAPDLPIFCFQKRPGNATILAPDIDFLDFDFYEGPAFIDTVPFAQKNAHAIFVGGTTGGMITADIARRCALPRLKAAQYFIGHDRVTFALPQIVQTTSEDARDILAQYPFCRTQRQQWQEQLSNRFLISIDGNGATCSRVVISLRSNSVLLKYDSDDILYYFHGLQPWLHYIPIARAQDVEQAFDLDLWSPGTLARIAEAGRAFGQRFLTRAAVSAYMAQLLLLYPACFAASEPLQATAAFRRNSPVKLHLTAHIEGKGDTLADDQGWAGLAAPQRRIEGFLISCDAGAVQARLTYQAILPDGARGPMIRCGDYCGTRGKAQPLHGFILHLAGDGPGMALLYEAVFSDGSRCSPVAPGTPCKTPSRAALVALRVTLADAPPPHQGMTNA